MDLNLPCGPWEQLASGKWASHPVTLYENAEGMLLLSLFEENKDKTVTGVLVLMKRVFLLHDSKYLPANAETVVLKKTGNQQLAYALLEAKPAYVSFNQRELFAAIKSQYNELKAMQLEGTKGEVLDDGADPGAREALLGDPFSLFSFSPSAKVELKPHAHPSLGKAGDENVYSDSLSLIVVGGLKEERLKALTVTCENALVSGVPCIIFDSTKRLEALKNFSPPKEWLEESGALWVDSPFESRVPGKDFFIDLSRIDPVFFAECMGLGVEAAAVLKGLRSLPSTIAELLHKVPLDSYAGQKVSRCLEVLQKTAPNVFNRSPPPNFALSTGSSKIFYYDLSPLPKEVRLLALDSVLSPFESEVRNAVLAVIEEDLSELPVSIYSLLNGLPAKGAAIAVNAESPGAPLPIPQLHVLKYPEDMFEEENQKTRFVLRKPFSEAPAK